MLTSDNRIIRDSFYRSGLAPPRLEPRANGQWIGNLPDPRSRIDDDCVLLDLITPHFGHMLLETPARHWPDIYDEFRDAYRDLKPIATRTHGLSLQRSEWPSYLTDFLESLQIKIHDIHFIDQPSSFRSLFVPSRISPYSSFGINRSYFDLLNRSSNWFKNNTGANSGGDCFSDRIYLSRSKLINGNRYLSNELIVEEIFSKHGFDIVHSQELDLGAQIEMINQATHIAGISGSQLHLCMYRSAPGLKLFRITPSDHNPPWDNMAARFTGTEVTTKSFSGSSRTNANDFSTWELSEEDLASLIETINSWCL